MPPEETSTMNVTYPDILVWLHHAVLHRPAARNTYIGMIHNRGHIRPKQSMYMTVSTERAIAIGQSGEEAALLIRMSICIVFDIKDGS